MCRDEVQEFTMTDATADEPQARSKSSLLGLILSFALAVAGAAGGFYAVRSGLLPGMSKGAQSRTEAANGTPMEANATAPTYVAMDPLIVSLNDDGNARHLKFRAELEVAPSHQQEVEQVMPRIIDVLNGYLRAVKASDLSDPTALTRLRAQMLRRVQIVVGKGQVLDLLIMEFVLN